MRHFLYTLGQATWGLPQSFLGLLLFLGNLKRPHFLFHGAICTIWRHQSSVSLGLFLFIAADKHSLAKAYSANTTKTLPVNTKLLVHEYGHTVQSLIAGPLYLLVFGIPSFIWAELPALRKRRQLRSISYYSLYTERLANYLGEKATGLPAIDETPVRLK